MNVVTMERQHPRRRQLHKTSPLSSSVAMAALTTRMVYPQLRLPEALCLCAVRAALPLETPLLLVMVRKLRHIHCHDAKSGIMMNALLHALVLLHLVLRSVAHTSVQFPDERIGQQHGDECDGSLGCSKLIV